MGDARGCGSTDNWNHGYRICSYVCLSVCWCTGEKVGHTYPTMLIRELLMELLDSWIFAPMMGLYFEGLYLKIPGKRKLYHYGFRKGMLFVNVLHDPFFSQRKIIIWYAVQDRRRNSWETTLPTMEYAMQSLHVDSEVNPVKFSRTYTQGSAHGIDKYKTVYCSLQFAGAAFRSEFLRM